MANLDALKTHDSIGTKNEKSLHSELKKWYAKSGDRLEEKVDGYIIDIVREDMLFEIQTRHFNAIKDKLKKLVQNHKVRLIYPVSTEKWITTMEADGHSVVKRRKSPKHGDVYSLFDELVSIPDYINEENFSLEVLLITEEEIRCRDGMGSWRRNGISIKDKKLLKVIGSVCFMKKEDFLGLIPVNLPCSFSNRDLSKAMGMPIGKCRKMSYCLSRMGIILQVGKKGNELLYEVKNEYGPTL